MRYLRYKKIAALLLMMFLGAAVFSGVMLYQAMRDYKEGAEVYSHIAQNTLMPVEQSRMDAQAILPEVEEQPRMDAKAISSEVEEQEMEGSLPSVDFAALQDINGDFIAWLHIPGTGISYPVVQGEDNNYYLNHLFDGTKNSAGCLFLDCRNSSELDERHSVIYGHNMKDGSMFNSITAYADQAFYDTNPCAYLITPGGTYEIPFFAGYVTADYEDAWELDFADEAAFMDWLREAERRSLFQGAASLVAPKRVITLSTCSYAFEGARFVLHGWLNWA